MVEENIKKSKNKIFGWLFVIYPIIIIIILPIVDMILMMLGIKNEKGPAGTITILKYLNVNNTIIYFSAFSQLIVGLVCPIIIFISGIYLLKSKKSGIKLVILAFLLDFIFRFLYLVINYSNTYTREIYLANQSKMIIFLCFFLVDLFIIYYFTKRKKSIF